MDGTRRFVSVFMEPDLSEERRAEIRQCIDRNMPIFIGIDTVRSMGDIDCIYVIGLREGESDDKINIYFQEVPSSLELGSVHGILVDRERIKTVYAAGEMRKRGNRVYYNMMSGTFMMGYPHELEAIEMTDIEFGRLQDYGIIVKHDKSGEPLIGRDVRMAELSYIKRCGYNAEIFNDRQRCLLDYRYQDAKGKGRGAAFLNARRNIANENKARVRGNPDERLYNPNY